MGNVVGIGFGGAVLSAMGVAVLRTVFVQLLGPADGRAGGIAMDVAVTGPMLMAVLAVVFVAVFALVLVAMVSTVGCHWDPPHNRVCDYSECTHNQMSSRAFY